MCGIVGLLARKPELRRRLGALATPMFTCMAERGPDSGGIAVFGNAVDEKQRKFNLFIADRNYDWHKLAKAFAAAFPGDDVRIDPISNHAILTTSVAPPRVRAWLTECDPTPHLLSVGRSMDLFKDMGHPDDIAGRYKLMDFQGTHCVGHTRMATESDVTPKHAHPFSAGEDFCLVHNGSLSNPHMLRRRLSRQGLVFETDNDTEAACRYVEWRLRQGESIERALTTAFDELDGFYTLLMGTPTELTLVRDAFACKPAIVAETADYVAISSEYRSLAHLPGVDDAKLFEPKPEVIYSWQV